MAHFATGKCFARFQTGHVKSYLVTWCDLFGVHRGKLIPATAITDMYNNAGFAPDAGYLPFTQPSDSDIIAEGDIDSAILLPWKHNQVWVPSNLYNIDKTEQISAPRNTLCNVQERCLEEFGFMPKSGVECEFLLLDKDTRLPDKTDNNPKPAYEVGLVMDNIEFLEDIITYMDELGWGLYQCDHEDANGQYECNWNYDQAVKTADKHMFFKFMVKEVAKKYNKIATFMAKPFPNSTGNGLHMHMTLHDPKSDKNVFEKEKGSSELSDTGRHFLGGILRHANAITALTNPTVNSFCRLRATTSVSGATWAPNRVSWGGNNRTHLVRIPDAPRIELRLADGSTNPYLGQAAVFAAGLDGIKNSIDPGHQSMLNMYTASEAEKTQYPELPRNLRDSLVELEQSAVLRDYLGDHLIDGYIKLRRDELSSYQNFVSEHEYKLYLDV